MRIGRHIAVLALATLGCSDQGDIVSIVPPRDDGHLSRTYTTLYAGQEIHYFPATLYVSVRFEPGLTRPDIDAFLKQRGFRVKRDRDPLYRLYVVEVNNAFTEAARLATNPEVAFVGPVFWRSCGTNFVLVGNQIIVYGDATDPSVDALLREANATLVRADPAPPRPEYVYELPWGRTDDLFDLCLSLTHLTAVDYAEPNFVLPCQ